MSRISKGLRISHPSGGTLEVVSYSIKNKQVSCAFYENGPDKDFSVLDMSAEEFRALQDNSAVKQAGKDDGYADNFKMRNGDIFQVISLDRQQDEVVLYNKTREIEQRLDYKSYVELWEQKQLIAL